MLNLDCLDNAIGLRGLCSDASPWSGLFINDLAGMSLDRIEFSTNPEDNTSADLWAKVHARAIGNFYADLVNNIAREVRINNVAEKGRIGRVKEVEESVTQAGDYTGAYIEVSGSSHFELYVGFVDYRIAAAGNIVVTAFDAATGEQLATVTQVGVIGWNRVQTNWAFPMVGRARKVFIAVTGGSETLQTQASTTCSVEACPALKGDRHTIVRGGKIATGSTVLESNIDFDGYTYGVIVDYIVQCSIKNFVCQHRDRLARSLLYRCAIELLMESFLDDRKISVFTMPDLEKQKDRIQMYEDMYEAELGAVLKGIQPTEDGLCIVCDHEISYVNTLPG